MQQALTQAPAGAGGSVPVRAGQSTTEVPIAALLGLLGSVAGQAAGEAEYFECDDAYLRFADGSYRCDPAVESERHSVLLELISADAVMLDEDVSPEQWLGNVYFGA